LNKYSSTRKTLMQRSCNWANWPTTCSRKRQIYRGTTIVNWKAIQ